MEKNYLEIMDWEGTKVKTTIDLNKLDEIKIIIIIVLSGDEICLVKYKNGKEEKFDSSNCRINGYFDNFDNMYTLYDISENINFIEEFKKREDSYDTDFLNNEVK